MRPSSPEFSWHLADTLTFSSSSLVSWSFLRPHCNIPALKNPPHLPPPSPNFFLPLYPSALVTTHVLVSANADLVQSHNTCSHYPLPPYFPPLAPSHPAKTDGPSRVNTACAHKLGCTIKFPLQNTFNNAFSSFYWRSPTHKILERVSRPHRLDKPPTSPCSVSIQENFLSKA